MRTGAAWDHLVTQYDSTGAVLPPVLHGGSAIAYSQVIGDERWFHFYFDDGGDGFRTNRSDGVWSKRDNDDFRLEFTKVLGDSCYKPITGSYVTLVKLDSTVTVPAGTFTCYLFRERYPAFPGQDKFTFIAPGVGFVRSDHYIIYNNGEPFLGAQALLVTRVP